MNLELIQQMKRNKRPFYLTFSGSKINIKNDLGEFNFMDLNKRLSFKELGLLNSVKHYVKKKVDFNSIHVPEKIQYIDFGFFFGFQENVIEFDLNMAFWEIARLKGYVNEEIYLKGIKNTKRGRLVAIGATAKTESKWFFDGNKYTFCKPKKILDSNKVFYSCAYETSKIINEIRIAIGNDYLFYWIDAIFLKANHSSIRKCLEISEKFGLNGKFKYLDLIYSDSNTISVIDNGGENERVFFKVKNKDL